MFVQPQGVLPTILVQGYPCEKPIYYLLNMVFLLTIGYTQTTMSQPTMTAHAYQIQASIVGFAYLTELFQLVA